MMIDVPYLEKKSKRDWKRIDWHYQNLMREIDGAMSNVGPDPHTAANEERRRGRLKRRNHNRACLKAIKKEIQVGISGKYPELRSEEHTGSSEYPKRTQEEHCLEIELRRLEPAVTKFCEEVHNGKRELTSYQQSSIASDAARSLLAHESQRRIQLIDLIIGAWARLCGPHKHLGTLSFKGQRLGARSTVYA